MPRHLAGIDFHRQRGSDAPLAAHGDAEQRSNDNEGGEGRRQPGHELKGREDQHVEDQHATPADAIGHVTEQERTERTRSQGQRDRYRHRRHAGVELLGDVGKDKHHDEKVEGIERPAEKAGRDGVPLLRSREHVAFLPIACRSRPRARAGPSRPFASA